MTLFAHHADAFLEVEVMGRKFPDGMTEHAVVFGVVAVLLALVSYGMYSAIRDWRRWQRKPAQPIAAAV
jgi:hypothetical protein